VSIVRSVNTLVLICIASFALQSPVLLNIHNLCQDINLMYPICFMNGGKWHVIPEQETDVNTIMSNHLEFDFEQDILEGALLYKIQWKQHTESNEFVKDGSKDIQLLVAWHVEHMEGLHIRALLVEHDKEFNLDEDKLRRLYQKYWHLLKAQIDPNRSNWMLNDTITLVTAVDVMYGGYRWDVLIIKGKGDDFKRPLWIDAER
jgi:hypothetical protein